MAGIPGIGTASVVGVIGKVIADKARLNGTLALINDTDPRQKVIEAVINDMYSFMQMCNWERGMSQKDKDDLMALSMSAPAPGRPQFHGTYMGSMMLKPCCLMVKRYCDKYGIRYNPYSLYRHNPEYDYTRTAPVDSKKVDERVEDEMNAYNEAQKEAREEQRKAEEIRKKKYDALPWYLKWSWLGIWVWGLIGALVLFFLSSFDHSNPQGTLDFMNVMIGIMLLSIGMLIGTWVMSSIVNKIKSKKK